MNITPIQKSIIERVVNVFETGKAHGDYSALVVYKDGPHEIPQITYGRSQTTEYGELKSLVKMYVKAKGHYSKEFEKYVEMIGSKPLSSDKGFRNLLKYSGLNDPIMKEVQDEFFDKAYFTPALEWAERYQFKMPLSMLVIYDSFIHSGGILWLIRSRFNEYPPNLGGDERVWIRAYVQARHEWLSNHYKGIVRKTVYRMLTMQHEINRSNWDLSIEPILANGVKVYSR